MSATSPSLTERENFSRLVTEWIDEAFGGNLSEAARRSRIARTTLHGYRDKDAVGWPGEEKKTKLAQAMNLTLAELNAKIEGVDLKGSVAFDFLLEQVRLRSDIELIEIDRAIADVREERLNR
jgi:hypothetical protein